MKILLCCLLIWIPGYLLAQDDEPTPVDLNTITDNLVSIPDEDMDYEQVYTLLSDKLLSGAGFGVDVVGSYDLVLRFEYTFNIEGQRGFFFHIKREF